jgi:Flp pilus assembly protein TadD
LRQGHRALRRLKIEAAVEAFAKAVSAAPGDRRTYIQLALAQTRGGDCEAARETVHGMLQHFPDEAVPCLFAGRCLLQCGDLAGAEPLLRSAAEQGPDNVLAQQYLALCELAKGDIEAASARINTVGLAANADFLALFSHEIERRLAPTSPATDKDIPPPSESPATAIARLEERAGRAGQGLFGKIKRRRIVAKIARLGERAYDRSDFGDALAAFEAVRRCCPNDADVLLGVGLSALSLDCPNHALQPLADAHARRPDDGFTASTYANALCCTGRIAEALAVFESVEPAGPDDFHAHYGRGACLAALGRPQPALEQFRIAFERYRLDAMDDCLIPSWQELLRRQK